MGPEPSQSACVQFHPLPFSVRGWIEMPFRGGPRPGQFVVKIGYQFQHQNLPPPFRLSAAGENPGWYGTCTSFFNASLVPWTECHGPAVVRGRPGRPAPVGTPPQRMCQLWCHGSMGVPGHRVEGSPTSYHQWDITVTLSRVLCGYPHGTSQPGGCTGCGR